jgi:general secretion pathway protein I
MRGAAGSVHSLPQAGFSLLEALAALAILAVAAAALIGAAETHVGRIEALERRTLAGFVAENRLTELRLAGAAAASVEPREFAGRDWSVEVSPSATDDPDLGRVDLVVRDERGGVQARLTGFIDQGGGR